jgi:hypothetical protein
MTIGERAQIGVPMVDIMVPTVLKHPTPSSL